MGGLWRKDLQSYTNKSGLMVFSQLVMKAACSYNVNGFAPKANVLCYCIKMPACIAHICINKPQQRTKRAQFFIP